MTGDDRFSPVLASDMRLAGLNGRLTYHLRYQLDTGDILSVPDALNPRLNTLAASKRQQALSLRLVTIGNHPAVLEHRYESHQYWTLDSVRQRRNDRTRLRWQTPRAELLLDVATGTSARVDPAVGLACGAAAALRFALQGESTAAPQSLRLRLLDCQSPHMPTAEGTSGATALEMSHFRDYGAGRETFSFTLLSHHRPNSLGAMREQAAYRLRWQRQQTLGAWRTSANASLHRTSSSAPDLASPAALSTLQRGADASLERDLPGATAFATWGSGTAGPWHRPTRAERRDQLRLGLDLSRWLTSVFPAAGPSLVMRWNGTLTRGQQPSAAEQSMDLQIAMRW
ncbi:MAG: hypothetical protein AAFX85_10290 [Pseudomonadota bacterium]